MARELKPCGTLAAYKRHLYHRQVPCKLCTDARRAAVVSRRRVPLQPCGTYAAYARHKRRKEPACRPCREALREYERNLRKKRAHERAREK